MDPITQQTVLAAAGAAGADPLYVDDVFSTYLFDATAQPNNPVVNGIDLDGEGGLVWIKSRTTTDLHNLIDTERTKTKILHTTRTVAESTSTNGITSFNSNGFTLGNDADGYGNNSPDGADMVSWTFRKAPGFFDVVTYTGTGSARTVAHNLGSAPGMIIVTNRTIGSNWIVYHRSTGATKKLELNGSGTATSNSGAWNDTEPTASVFTVGANNSGTDGSGNGYDYVAWVFAHDDAQFGTGGDESIIKCGTYPGNTNPVDVNLGFEPQWVLVKASDANYGWAMLDNMRGIVTGTADDRFLSANSTDEEQGQDMLDLTPTGFIAKSNANVNTNNKNYIYMAIRRPNKPPTAGTDVFQSLTYSGNSTDTTRSTNILVDFLFTQRTTGGVPYAIDRMRGTDRYLSTSSASQGDTQPSAFKEFGNDYIKMGNGSIANETGNDYLLSMFKRAPGFMDVVAYSGTVTGNSDSQTVPHNLGVTPELMLVKRRSGATQWHVYSNALPTPLTQILVLNDSGDAVATTNAWGTSSSPTAPNANNFTVGYATGTGWVTAGDFVAYLFATLPGISKVGSYSATGNEINVNCGFTAGARFVLIKRMNSPGSDWYLWDTTRGYNGTSDNFLRLNTSGGQDDNIANIDDHLDALPAGFTVRASSGVNTSGGNYLFLAIA